MPKSSPWRARKTTLHKSSCDYIPHRYETTPNILELELLFSFQVMVVYNAVGHILRGHPSKPNRVIDYVVMERHLETMGSGLGWRIAGKLPPQIPWKKALPTTSDKPQGALPTA